MSPDFSIIIPTTGSLPPISKLLKSLEKLNGLDRAEILVVQNPPCKKILSLQKQFAHLPLYFFSSEAGVNHARNKGLQISRGRLLFFFDDDCIISDPNLLLEHSRAHADNAWAFAVGGFYRYQGSSPLDQAYDEIQRDWLLKNRLFSSGECQTLLGGHFSIKRQSDLPLFDSSILYGGAETEYFFRLRSQGYRFLLIDLEVEHSPRLTLASLARKAQMQGHTHRRLVKDGYFMDGPWVNRPSAKTNKFKDFYFRNFRDEPNSRQKSSALRALRNQLHQYHQKICFYLENRELF